jgi:hypothetical protein
MNSESAQPEPISSAMGEMTGPVVPEIEPMPGCSSSVTQPNIPDEEDILMNQFLAENPNLAKLTWEGAEALANAKAESVNNSRFSNMFDDEDLISEAGGNNSLLKQVYFVNFNIFLIKC